MNAHVNLTDELSSLVVWYVVVVGLDIPPAKPKINKEYTLSSVKTTSTRQCHL